MNTMKRLAVAMLLGCLSQTANASLVGVSSIKIESAITSWLQVTEVIAWDAFTERDAALESNGAVAMAADWWETTYCDYDGRATCTIDGDIKNEIYHSGTINDAYLLISFAAPVTLDWVDIIGRYDEFNSRDVYKVSFIDQAGQTFYVDNADARNANSLAHIDLSNETLIHNGFNLVADVPSGSLSGMGCLVSLMAFGAYVRRKKY